MLQVEQAAQAEFGVVPSSEVLSAMGAQAAGRAPHNATTPLKLPRSDSTPIRPAPGAAKQQQQDKHQKALELEETVRKINTIESQWGASPSGDMSEQVINLSFREENSFVASTLQHAHIEETTSTRGREGADISHLETSPYKLHGAAVHGDDASSGARGDHTASELLSHSSDAVVKPIVGNKAIEPIDAPGFKEKSLTFEALSPDQLAAMAEADLEPHMTLVFKALHKVTQLTQASVTPTTATLAALNDRINILGYLCSLAGSAEVSKWNTRNPFAGGALYSSQLLSLPTGCECGAEHALPQPSAQVDEVQSSSQCRKPGRHSDQVRRPGGHRERIFQHCHPSRARGRSIQHVARAGGDRSGNDVAVRDLYPAASHPRPRRAHCAGYRGDAAGIGQVGPTV